ncbi:MAG: hypothetical protein QNJ61_08600, partial [Desulfobacterales bacterium]|nr:hypothetical protein [Desulfobacterales bacterium]
MKKAPMDLIIEALHAGRNIQTTEHRDAFALLAEAIQSRFAASDAPDGAMVLKRFQTKPKAWEPALRELLVETGAGSDKTIVDAARHLLGLTGPPSASPPDMAIHAETIQGPVQANRIGHLEQHFHPPA